MSTSMPPKGASSGEIEAAVDKILAHSSLAEKVAMMSGAGFFAAYLEDGKVWAARPYRAGGGIDRLGLPPLYFTDGPRGVARGNSTCFPCTMARGATFDADLEYRIGEAMGIETRAQGCTLSGAICMNILRHPAWGRAQETYGEDSWHLGVMGAALGTGIQAHNVVATVKHFAANSMENMRFSVDVTIGERALHEVYLPHFKHALAAGVASVMSAYNKINGEYCGQNRHLLTDILRGEWGFGGFVHSDWILGVYKLYGAAAGLDVENPEPRVFGEALVKAVEQGSVEPHVIDTACRRILATQFRFACAEDPLSDYPLDLVACDAHRNLALEAAEKSAVLLENDGCLPFDRGTIRTLAVLGRLASLENTGDNGSSKVRPPYVVTALDGLNRYLGEGSILTADETDLAAAQDAAKAADASVVVVGYTADDEGEYLPGDFSMDGDGAADPKSRGGDRVDLGIAADQIALIKAAAASGKPVVVVIVAGSAVLVEEWRDDASAIMQTFYGGMEGGTALARLLLGEVSPSGRLPFTVARDAAHYPFFDRDVKQIEYGLWHGYTKFERDGLEPRYAFGHGLSYGRFDYRALRVETRHDSIAVSVAIHNAGSKRAEEVVLCFVRAPGKVVERPERSLRAFARVALAPGETRVVNMTIAKDDLRWRDPSTHDWRFEPGHYRVSIPAAGGQKLSALIAL